LACEPNEQEKGIIWLASYPKSGNTWFRIFLRNLVGDHHSLSKLDGIGFGGASCRHVFDDCAGVDSSDMTLDEIDLLRPRVYELIVDESNELPIYIKTHDAYTLLPDGQAMLSRRATAGAIYFVRNPWDVAVSFAYHQGHEDFDRTIAALGSPTDAFCRSTKRLHRQLRQKTFGWSGHIHSWLEADVPVHIMRYEDMKQRPLETFTAAIRFAGLENDEGQIAQALEDSRFERLQEMERDGGFREKNPKSELFFRKGEVGSWREKLNEEQVQQIIDGHEEMMRRFGYLDEDRRPTV